MGKTLEVHVGANHEQMAVLNSRMDLWELNIAFIALKKKIKRTFSDASESQMTTAAPLPRGRCPVE